MEYKYGEFDSEYTKLYSKGIRAYESDWSKLSWRMRDYGKLIGVIDEDNRIVDSSDNVKKAYIELYKKVYEKANLGRQAPSSGASYGRDTETGGSLGTNTGEITPINEALDVLGLSKDQALDENTLKREYKKLSMRWHPDRPSGNTENFQKIQSAYELLMSDEAQRILRRA